MNDKIEWLTVDLLEEPNSKHPLKMKGRNDQKVDAQADTPAIPFISS